MSGCCTSPLGSTTNDGPLMFVAQHLVPLPCRGKVNAYVKPAFPVSTCQHLISLISLKSQLSKCVSSRRRTWNPWALESIIGLESSNFRNACPHQPALLCQRRPGLTNGLRSHVHIDGVMLAPTRIGPKERRLRQTTAQ